MNRHFWFGAAAGAEAVMAIDSFALGNWGWGIFISALSAFTLFLIWYSSK